MTNRNGIRQIIPNKVNELLIALILHSVILKNWINKWCGEQYEELNPENDFSPFGSKKIFWALKIRRNSFTRKSFMLVQRLGLKNEFLSTFSKFPLVNFLTCLFDFYIRKLWQQLPDEFVVSIKQIFWAFESFCQEPLQQKGNSMACS